MLRKSLLSLFFCIFTFLVGGIHGSLIQPASAQERPPCIQPYVEDNERCVPGEVTVTGRRLLDFVSFFDVNPFRDQVIPSYYSNDIYFRLLPAATSAYPSRGAELMRRQRIHNCIANNLAAGMRSFGLWTVREVKFSLPDGRYSLFDIVYGAQPGVPQGVIEVKTVLDYEVDALSLLKRNQPAVAEAIVRGQAIPSGNNAATAGFWIEHPMGKGLPVAITPFLIGKDCYIP